MDSISIILITSMKNSYVSLSLSLFLYISHTRDSHFDLEHVFRSSCFFPRWNIIFHSACTYSACAQPPRKIIRECAVCIKDRVCPQTLAEICIYIYTYRHTLDFSSSFKQTVVAYSDFWFSRGWKGIKRVWDNKRREEIRSIFHKTRDLPGYIEGERFSSSPFRFERIGRYLPGTNHSVFFWFVVRNLLCWIIFKSYFHPSNERNLAKR